MDKITLSLTVKEAEELKNTLDFLISDNDYVDDLINLSNRLNEVLKKSKKEN